MATESRDLTLGTPCPDFRLESVDGRTFARRQPSGTDRVFMLDFGAARKVDSDTWGVLGFSGTYFANGQVLQALESASDGYHVRGHAFTLAVTAPRHGSLGPPGLHDQQGGMRGLGHTKARTSHS